MSARLEHANVTVGDVDAAIDFLLTAIPEFRVRGRGVGPEGKRWVHVGSDTSYIAINEADSEEELPSAAQWRGVNHLGFVVDDAEAVKRRLVAKGYREGYISELHPHRKRIYLHDRDDNEWEFVEYLSQDIAERNDYSLG
jgi:catechol 2,3-dioxygenase-like lactoylglutathione lyase family enzyme